MDLLSRDGFGRGQMLRPVIQKWVQQGWVGRQYPDAALVPDYEEDFIFFEDPPVGEYVSAGLALYPALSKWLFPLVSPDVFHMVKQFGPGTGEGDNFIFIWMATPDKGVTGRTYADVPVLETITPVVDELSALEPVVVSEAELFELFDELYPQRGHGWIMLQSELATHFWHQENLEAVCPVEWLRKYGLSGAAIYWSEKAAEVLDDDGLRLLSEMVLEHTRTMMADDPYMESVWFPVETLEGLIEACRRVMVE